MIRRHAGKGAKGDGAKVQVGAELLCKGEMRGLEEGLTASVSRG